MTLVNKYKGKRDTASLTAGICEINIHQTKSADSRSPIDFRLLPHQIHNIAVWHDAKLCIEIEAGGSEEKRLHICVCEPWLRASKSRELGAEPRVAVVERLDRNKNLELVPVVTQSRMFHGRLRFRPTSNGVPAKWSQSMSE